MGSPDFELETFLRQNVNLGDEIEVQTLLSVLKDECLMDWGSIQTVTNDELREFGVDKINHRKTTLC